MSFAYVIAFSGKRFLMVFNPRRRGWEMPGGRIESGESPDEAAKREFREETGQIVVIKGHSPFRDGQIFTGELIRSEGEGEMEWRLFDALPEELAFPEVEYRDQLDWARRTLAIEDENVGLTSKS